MLFDKTLKTAILEYETLQKMEDALKLLNPMCDNIMSAEADSTILLELSPQPPEAAERRRSAGDSDRADVHVCVAPAGDCPGAEACRRTAAGQLVAAVLPQRAQRLGRVAVERCRGVHLGHVTYVLGPVNFTRVLQKNTISQQIIVTSDDAPGGQEGEPEVQVVRRLEWLAQPPLHTLTPLQRPVSTVVISHTATDSSTSMGKNTMIVRRLQTFHIEGRMWPDIGYNFMVGMDGQVYEGRGWASAPEAVGSGMAQGCLSVAFVGSFSTRLPSADALAALHRLLRLGEREGHLAADYRLIAENQLDPDTESPGRALAGLMQGWPRWAPQL
ncbi:peptidoglycan-recognition protein LE-like [Schistocerca piceifrons]|uniref:peptidoglycan-recognition protein LE-like n=1 Tax=Schistocerca piceifrons TaxID=274613 RepID=UPI001F5E7651|nr:peptidoglycan-recognition protein LE-like [Schistocerca piceifrons]